MSRPLPWWVKDPEAWAEHLRVSVGETALVELVNELADALDPERAPGPVKTLADMTPEERAAIEREYGCPISPQAKLARAA